METLAIQFVVVSTGIAICGVVVCCTKWLVASEREYPRETFPVTQIDLSRGTLAGVIVGVAWSICDVTWHQFWQRPVWNLDVWELRFGVFILFLLAGRLTITEIFRVWRYKKNAGPPTC